MRLRRASDAAVSVPPISTVGLGPVDSVLRVSDGPMRELARSTEDTVLLAGLVDGEVRCLRRVDAVRRALSVTYEPGDALPLASGAPARVLLAWLDPEELGRTLRYAEVLHSADGPAPSPVVLALRLAATRATGYAVSRGELDDCVVLVAAPVRGQDGVVAALSVAGSCARLPDERVTGLTGDVCAAAARISVRLGR